MDGVELARAGVPRNDAARRVEWDLTEHAGKRARLEIVDGVSEAGFAWIAAGGFDPDVAPIPSGGPAELGVRRRAVAELVAAFGLTEVHAELAGLLQADDVEPETCGALARATVAIHGNSDTAALATVVGDPTLDATLRRQACAAIATATPEASSKTLEDTVRAVPTRLQVSLAESLAGRREGATRLVTLVETGLVPAGLLTRKSVRDKLLAAWPDAAQKVEALTADLPEANEEIQKAVASTIVAYGKAPGEVERGRVVFDENCGVCHQIAGKGGEVGPQLDGIGGRGLERVVEDMLDPNRNVDVAFRATNYVLEDGSVITGLFRREEGATIIVADSKGEEVTIAKADVLTEEKTESSPMPEDFQTALEPQALLDLLAYLLAQRPR